MASVQVKEEMDCLSNRMSPIQPGSIIYKIIYPEKMDKDEKFALKKEIMKAHPETLFADSNAKGQITNLLFLTDHTMKWLHMFCSQYKIHEKETKGWVDVLEVGDEENPKCLKIHVYKKGTVMLQGTEERLRGFEQIFISLKDKASADDANVLSGENKGKITSYYPIIKGTNRQSETDNSHRRRSQGDNTDNQKEEEADKTKEENKLTEAEPVGTQSQGDSAGKQEGEKSNVKNEENGNKITETK